MTSQSICPSVLMQYNIGESDVKWEETESSETAAGDPTNQAAASVDEETDFDYFAHPQRQNHPQQPTKLTIVAKVLKKKLSPNPLTV